VSELAIVRLSNELFRRAERLTARAQACPPLRAAAERLAATVVRPLAPDGPGDLDPPAGEAVTAPGPDGQCSDEQWSDELWLLTLDVTSAVAGQQVSGRFGEAVAGLQRLALEQAADGPSRVERRMRLASLLGHLEPAVVVTVDGPYLTTGVDRVSDWLGQESGLAPVAALCRCGASRDKPFCDGSHATTGFTGDQAADRVPDRVDVHPGVAVTVRDNRGTCAHSGLCTDRLPAVFRLGQEPFVVPNGARMDEIVGAVRACPSGALSLGRRDGTDAHDQVDSDRPTVITVSRNGPYRVTGGLPLRRPDGTAESRNDGASLEHYSLCRCGQSRNKPFCSGRHWDVSFRDPLLADDHEPTLFEWAGGMPALLALTTVFYTKHVPDRPELVGLFGSMSADHPEKVAAWLSEVFGGPAAYSAAWGGYSTMLAHHIGKGITEQQRSVWVAGMAAAADEAGLPADPEFRAAFAAYLEWGSRLAIENSASGASPPPGMPVPKWDWVCGATPGSRVSAQPVLEGAVVPEQALPADGEPVSFEQHVKQLFRASDRASMRFAFDLWDADDVRAHGPAILTRIEQGSMPCDGAWPAERTAVLRRWLDEGTA
jgi:CDGSH-type Zn-finger protein/truncated hemoglobin YjbI/ferredoxin